MSSSTQISLLDHDVVRRRASVRLVVGRAWGQLRGALASSRANIRMENSEEDADIWHQLEGADDAGGTCRGYVAIDEAFSSPQGNAYDRLKSVVDNGEHYEQENVSANKPNRHPRGECDGYISYPNGPECGDGDIVKRSADPDTASNSSSVKHRAVGSGGYVAFA